VRGTQSRKERTRGVKSSKASGGEGTYFGEKVRGFSPRHVDMRSSFTEVRGRGRQ